MIQLTSDAALVPLYSIRSPRVNTQTLLNIPNRAAVDGLLRAHRPLTDRPALCDSGCSLLPDPLPFVSRQMTVFQLRSAYISRGRDFNSLAYVPAGRVHCEYKAQERIHRDVADSRLLAIPASRGRVADLDPNWDRL